LVSIKIKCAITTSQKLKNAINRAPEKFPPAIYSL